MTARRIWPAHAALGALVIVALYAHTLHFGLYWDDFDVLRRWSWADLGHAVTGDYRPWAREGIFFYRPLTSAYYALVSAVFGLNGTALHLIPFVTLTLASTLTGVYVERETQSRAAGLTGSLLYAVHPLTATAVGPWIANQYQGFLVIAVLSALIQWRALVHRGRDVDVWLVLALIGAAWLKEDGLMLGSALVAIQAARARVTHDLPMPSRRFAAGILTLTLSLVLWRAAWLPSQFGYGVPDAWSMVANLSRAWRYALVWDTGSAPLSTVLTLAKSAIAIGAVALVVRRRREPAARVALTGVVLIAVMNLPLALVSSENRWHVVGLGAVLIASAVLSTVRRRLRWALLAITVALFAASSWERIAAFAPCSAESLEHARWAMTLPELPVQLHAWLSTRDAACRAGHYDEFAVPMRELTWGRR